MNDNLRGYFDESLFNKNISVEWTPEVVYSVYCNDDLETLPIGILNDMKLHIENTINNTLIKGEK